MAERAAQTDTSKQADDGQAATARPAPADIGYDIKSFDPPPDLQNYLHSSFSIVGEFPAKSFKLLPGGIAAVCLFRDRSDTAGFSVEPNSNEVFADGWVHGVYTTPAYHYSSRADCYGIRFHPIGLHAIFGIDMQRLANKFFRPSEILPDRFLAEIWKLDDIRHTKAGHDSIFQLIREWTKEPLDAWLSDFYWEIRSSQQTISLADAYERSGRSPKYVNERFKRAVGITPKVFSRILRLDALLLALDPSQQVNWAEHAHNYGFYDQSHFNRDFRNFTGLTPSEYLHWRRDGPMPIPKGELRSVVAEA